MKRLFTHAFLALLIGMRAAGQEGEKKEMPRLDIPEITIVGKKAITLPFARKGEVLDIELFEAPAPDSSLLERRPYSSFAAGTLPRFRETMHPWRAYAEAGIGSFSTLSLNGAVSYSELEWGATAHAGFAATQGHVDRAKGSSLNLGVDGSAIVATDNDFLGRFRATGNLGFAAEEYGMFGIPDTADRTRRSLDLTAHVTSAEERGVGLSFGLGVHTLSIEDEGAGNPGKASAVSPVLSTSVSADVEAVRIVSMFRYESSSLAYGAPTEAPTLLDLSSTAQWKISEYVSAVLGAKYVHGTHSDGGSGTLFSPIAVVRWEPMSNISLSIWWEPEVRVASFANHSREIPYLIREPLLRHERKPIYGGVTAAYIGGMTSVEIRGSYAETRETPLALADSGVIQLGYAPTRQVKLDVSGSLRVSDQTRVYLGSIIQHARENGSSVQLPMTPSVELHARGEFSLPIPIKIWSSLNYVGSRNIDIAGTKSLSSYLLLNAGATSAIIPWALLSLDVENVLGKTYQWWSGYTAPGTRLTFRMQFTM